MIVDPLLRGQMAASRLQLSQGIHGSSEVEWDRIRIRNAPGRKSKSVLKSGFETEVAQLSDISEGLNKGEKRPPGTEQKNHIPMFVSTSGLYTPGRKPDEASVFLPCTTAASYVRGVAKRVCTMTY